MIESAREVVAEQLAPILALHAELTPRWSLALDVAQARTRLRAGLVAYDPLDVIASAGDLAPHVLRATLAIECAGLVSNRDAIHARERLSAAATLVAAWLGGQPTPRDPVKAVARRAAVIVAHSILVRASRDVIADAAPRPWSRGSCPCCGSAPDFAVPGDGERLLICARCDTGWRHARPGCIGCGLAAEPGLGRIDSPALGFRLIVCHGCGRYLKERTAPQPVDPLLDRALTAELDAAAERRGLRL